MKRFEKNLVLIGMPGCGKTTIGKILSSRLNMNFIDLDEYIEKSSSSTIPEIFKKGEEYFRDLESKAVEEVAKEKSSIISTGGGVIKRKSNMSILKENGIIVFIDRSLEDIINDINTETRPLLKNNEEEINRLFNERYDIYRKYCDFIVNNRDIDTVVNDIINLIGGLKIGEKID
ncbi:shikimate kinase [Clostridium sp. cel8]|uniref:shikimate kinase n=1 Tax=Clostridium sp. cel8 TaxID=2663123 RepID=UPI0015F62267|nr:shikimate kinase [Clostridium sp. cel8]MBA5851018.1 shikimate kinase [Clostridium sp. cel8]